MRGGTDTGMIGNQANRIGPVDGIKIALAMLVVLIHTDPLRGVSESLNFWLVNYAARIAVPMFFALSGYVLSRNIKTKERYILKWAQNLVRVLALWTLLYWAYASLFEYAGAPGGEWLAWSYDFVAYSLLRGYLHLWYLPSLLAGGIILYHLRNVNRLKMLLVSACLYVLGLFAVSWSAFSNPAVETVLEPVLYYFENVRNSPLNSLPFLLIGFYLEDRKPRYPKKALLILFALLWAAYFLEVRFVSARGPKGFDMYLSLLPIVFCAMALLQDSFGRGHNPFVAKMSLYIYLVHIMVLKAFDSLMEGGLKPLLVMAVSLLLAFLFTWIELAGTKKKRPLP